MTPVFNLLDFAEEDPELFQVFLDENKPAVNKLVHLLKIILDITHRKHYITGN